MVSFLSPIVRGKELRSEKTNFSANRPLSNIDIVHFARKYIPHFKGVFMRDLLPEAPKSWECGILNLDNSRSSGAHLVACNKNKNNVHYFDSFGNLQPPREVVKYMGHKYNTITIEFKSLIHTTVDTCASLFYFLS